MTLENGQELFERPKRPENVEPAEMFHDEEMNDNDEHIQSIDV